MVENWIVGVLVVFAAGYSLWYLLPSAARRYLARLHSALGPAPSCASGCSSCGKCPGTAPADAKSVSQSQVHPLTFHRKA